jgi:hypothetical protein
MDEFVKGITDQMIPSDFNKNSTSKLTSISKTQNLISEFEQLKHDKELIAHELEILKNQNSMLIKENHNLMANNKSILGDVDMLRNKVKVNNVA